MQQIKHKAGNEHLAEERLAKKPPGRDEAGGRESGRKAPQRARVPAPGRRARPSVTAEGDVKFLAGAERPRRAAAEAGGARRRPGWPPSAGRGRGRPGGAGGGGERGLAGSEVNKEQGPSRPSPDRSPRWARAPRGAKAQPPATYQDALEEVALLRRQLHARHRGGRGGWAAGRSVPRGWAPGRAAAESRVRAMGQFIGLELELGRFGWAFAQGWQWKRNAV